MWYCLYCPSGPKEKNGRDDHCLLQVLVGWLVETPTKEKSGRDDRCLQ